jgi:hypothetical protein
MSVSIVVCYDAGRHIYCLVDIFVRIHTAGREPQRPTALRLWVKRLPGRRGAPRDAPKQSLQKPVLTAAETSGNAFPLEEEFKEF